MWTAIIVLVGVVLFTVLLVRDTGKESVNPSGSPSAIETPAEAVSVSASLSFPKRDLSGVGSTAVSLSDQRGVPSAWIEEIVEGLSKPPAPDFLAVFPVAQPLRAAYTGDDGTVYLDFDPQALVSPWPGVEMELLAVEALVKTIAANVESAKRVKILANGTDRETFWSHVYVRAPLELR